MRYFRKSLKNFHVILCIPISRTDLSKLNKQVGAGCLAYNQASFPLPYVTPDNSSLHSNPRCCQVLPPPLPTSFCCFSIHIYPEESKCLNCSAHILKFSLGARCLLGANICERKKVEAGLHRGRSQDAHKPSTALANLKWPSLSPYPSMLSHPGRM